MKKLFKSDVKITKHKSTGMSLPNEKVIYTVADSQKEALEKIEDSIKGLEVTIKTTSLVSENVIE